MLHKNANPKITLTHYGYSGGNCSYDSLEYLSKVGEWLGKSNVNAIRIAAGPVVQMAASLALLQFYPGNGISAVSLLLNADYAISALSKKAFSTEKIEDLDESHDFCYY